MNLSDFSLLKEDNDSYTVGHPNGKSLRVPKQGLSDVAHQKIKRMSTGGSPGAPDASPVDDVAAMVAQAPNSSSIDTPPADTPDPAVISDRAPAATSQQGSTRSTPGYPAMSGFQQEMAGNQAQANAEGQLGQSDAKLIGDTQAQVSALPTQQEIIAQNKALDDQLMAKYQSKEIDPDSYVKHMGTPARVASAIGLIFSGLGSGLTKQPNLAYEMLNQSINNDIEKQKNSQSSAYNLWQMNRQKLGSDLAANLATQNQMYTGLSYKLQQAQANAASPMAKARLDQANGLLQQKMDQIRYEQSILTPSQETTGGAAPGTEAAYTNHLNALKTMGALGRPGFKELGTDMESKLIPGVGVASTALRPEDKDDFATFNKLDKAIDDAKNFTTTVGTTLGPGSGLKDVPLVGGALNSLSPQSTNDALAQSKRENIVLGLKALYHSHRLDEHSFDAYMNAVPNPGAFRSDKAVAQLNELQENINQNKSSLSQSLGVTPFKQAPVDQTAVQWARSNPNDPRAAKILQMNGAK